MSDVINVSERAKAMKGEKIIHNSLKRYMRTDIYLIRYHLVRNIFLANIEV
jgi:hypothetical protein